MEKELRSFKSFNKVYYRELDHRKKEYIKFLRTQNLSDKTIDNYQNQMYKIRAFEEMIDKNIEYFTINETCGVLEDMVFSSESSALSYKNRIIDYLNFCIAYYGVKKDISLFKEMLNTEYIKMLVNKRAKYLKYISQGSLYEALQELVNPQDILMVLLIYEGVRGTKQEDLINIRKKQYDKENKVLKYIEQNTGNVKILKCNQFLCDIIEKTILEDIYYFNNGKCIGINTETSMLKTEYLIEPTAQLRSKMGNYNIEKNYGETIQARILKIFKKYLNINGGNITVQSLYHSGIINRMVRYTESECIGKKMSKKDCASYIEKNEKLGKQSGYRLYDVYNNLYDLFKGDIIIWD